MKLRWNNKNRASDRSSKQSSRQGLKRDVLENEEIFRNLFVKCSDIVFQKIKIGGHKRLLLIYTDGMIDTDKITSNIFQPLKDDSLPLKREAIEDVAQSFQQLHLPFLHCQKIDYIDKIAEYISKGHLAIFFDGEATALMVDIRNLETRDIQESTTEATLRGPKESFTENLRINTTMLRRILATPKLKTELMQIGKLTRTDVLITYIEGVVSEPVLEEVRKRIKRIEVDGVLESGNIEESIEETHGSPFPQILNSERPDVVARALLEGKVAVLTSGTPFALVMPMTFWNGLQSPDDYSHRFLYVTMIRWLRYLFTLFSMVFLSLYIALTTFHPEMVPPKLMINIASLRERAPFPTVIEVFMMELMFEGLQEAGIRLPKQIGPLVSIVGALVLGDAAVNASIISAPVVIVVSATGIASFIIPRYNFGFSMRMLRYPLLILSGLFGLFGTAIGIIAILIHMIQLHSFGVPYYSPVAPTIVHQLKDVFTRWPRKRVKKRMIQNE